MVSHPTTGTLCNCLPSGKTTRDCFRGPYHVVVGYHVTAFNQDAATRTGWRFQ